MGDIVQRIMEKQQYASTENVLQQSSLLDKNAATNGCRHPASTPNQNSGDGENPWKSSDVGQGRENQTTEASSLSRIDRATWESENGGLEDEFSALKGSLSTYLELQRQTFRNDGGEVANSIYIESTSVEGAHNRGLLLSDAVSYIQHLEGLQQQLFNRKMELEGQLSRYEKQKSEDGRAV